MRRFIVALAIVALLSVKFGDVVAHVWNDDHHHEHGATQVVAVIEADDHCGQDDFHTAAHCASHMADTMQRSQASSIERGAVFGDAVLISSHQLRDGRSLIPPIPPPLA